jgi:predicted ATP-grasp superfamily ATP-dependent carboligase
VTDASDRGPLAGLRALGRAGLTTVAVAQSGSAGLRSRYADAGVSAPDSSDDPAGFAESLAATVDELRPRVIYPGREEAIDAILDSPQCETLAPLLPYPRLEALAALRDKGALPDLAAEHGLSTPITLAEGPPDDVIAEVGDRPCAVKSAMPGGAVELTRVARSAAELDEILGGLDPSEHVVAQELCEGELVGVALVVDGDGELVARFQQTASRTWPLEAGASCNAVSVAPEDRLVERARRMVAATGFAGLAHLQFLDCDDRCVLIDVNPRFYGSMPLALKAGVNLPSAWHGVATGDPRPEPSDYRVGVRFRWFEGNLLAAARGHSLRALTDGGLGPRAGAVWSADDPVASAAWGAGAVLERVGRRFRRAAAAPRGLAKNRP